MIILFSGILTAQETSRLGAVAGGGLSVRFKCTGCTQRSLTFHSSTLLEGTKRSSVGVAIAVAFLASGHTWAEYSETLEGRLGISALSDKPYASVMDMCAPHVRSILQEMMDSCKEGCREIPADELGSSQRLVVTSDGVWGTRGFHSTNGSFVIVNYLNGGVMWYGHASQKGNGDDLYKGTSRSMEAHLALECFQAAKDEGFCISCVWQDDDSSATLSVKNAHPDCDVFRCSGHICRACANRLNEMAAKKSFTPQQKAIYRNDYPEVNFTYFLASCLLWFSLQ